MSNVNIIFLQVRCRQHRKQAMADDDNQHSGWSIRFAPGSIYITIILCTPLTGRGLYQAFHVLLTLPHFCQTGSAAAPLYGWPNGLGEIIRSHNREDSFGTYIYLGLPSKPNWKKKKRRSGVIWIKTDSCCRNLSEACALHPAFPEDPVGAGICARLWREVVTSH